MVLVYAYDTNASYSSAGVRHLCQNPHFRFVQFAASVVFSSARMNCVRTVRPYASKMSTEYFFTMSSRVTSVQFSSMA